MILKLLGISYINLRFVSDAWAAKAAIRTQMAVFKKDDVDRLLQENDFVFEKAADLLTLLTWSHTQACPSALHDGEPYNCNQGIISTSHMECFEQTLRMYAQLEEKQEMRLKVTNRSSLEFISKWLCVVDSRKPDSPQ